MHHSAQNKSIKELDIRKQTGANIIGLKDTNGEYVINPNAETVLTQGTKLIVLGNHEQIQQLQHLIIKEEAYT